MRVGAPVSFTVGPIASSSPILKIAVTGEEMDLEEQERLITKATEVLTREFVKTNEDLETRSGFGHPPMHELARTLEELRRRRSPPEGPALLERVRRVAGLPVLRVAGQAAARPAPGGPAG